jgi:hypothetical protein
VAASVLLSLFPFLNVILSLCRHAALERRRSRLSGSLGLLPGRWGLHPLQRDGVGPDRRFQIGSLVLLLLVANGVFEPLRWRSTGLGGRQESAYWRNQIVSLGLIFACGTLALLSMMFTALPSPCGR